MLRLIAVVAGTNAICWRAMRVRRATLAGCTRATNQRRRHLRAHATAVDQRARRRTSTDAADASRAACAKSRLFVARIVGQS